MLTFILKKLLPITMLILFVGSRAWGQSYPNESIRLINPFAPGGYSDQVARAFAEALSAQLGQSVIVENRPGAGGSVGVGQVSRAKPDGYTLGMATNGPLTINQTLLGNLNYDPQKDLTFISRFARIPSFILVPKKMGITNLDDLLSLIRKNPGKYEYASGGQGTSQNLAGELLKEKGKLDIEHVPYKGESPAIIDVIGGRVTMAISSSVASLAHIRSGQLVPLAVTSAERSVVLPEVPTVAEKGFPGFDVSAWFSLIGPAGLPDDVVQKLYQATIKAVASDKFKAYLKELGASVSVLSPAEFKSFVDSEIKTWTPIVESFKEK